MDEYITALSAVRPEADLTTRIAQLGPVGQTAKMVEEDLKQKCRGAEPELVEESAEELHRQLGTTLRLLVGAQRQDVEEVRRLAEQFDLHEAHLIQQLAKSGDWVRLRRHAGFIFERYACALSTRGPIALPRVVGSSFAYPSLSAQVATLMAPTDARRWDLLAQYGTIEDAEKLFGAPEVRRQRAEFLLVQALQNAKRTRAVASYEQELHEIQARVARLEEVDLGRLAAAAAARGLAPIRVAQDILHAGPVVKPVDKPPVVRSSLDQLLSFLSSSPSYAWSRAERRLIRALVLKQDQMTVEQRALIAALDAQARGVGSLVTKSSGNRPEEDMAIARWVRTGNVEALFGAAPGPTPCPLRRHRKH